jgi:hypothetical protein
MEGSLVAYKVFTNGSVLNASEVNDNLMNQAVITFTNSTARASAITSPVEGMVTYLADTDTYQFWNGSAWTALVSASSGNAIINGGFDIWQRGTSFTNPSSFAYTVDRWRPGYDGSGATRVLSRQNHTPGAAPVAGQERPFFFRFNQTVAGSAGTFNLFQTVLEGVETFAGQNVTISFYAKAAANITLPKLEITQSFGVGGSSGVDTVVASSVAVTTSWQRFSYSFTVPSISGKTVGTNSVFAFNFYLPINTTFTFDLDGVQLESGSTATAFRRNANSLEGELAACQRYYFRSQGLEAFSGHPVTGFTTSSTAANMTMTFPTSMRVKPTSLEFGNVAVNDTVNASYFVSNVTLDNGTPSSVLVGMVISGATSGRPVRLINSNNVNGFIAVSAEL